MRIVCFGDSITGARPDQPYLHAYLKWPDILGALIEAVTGAPAEVFNAGDAGDATEAAPGRGPGTLARLDSEELVYAQTILTTLRAHFLFLYE